MSLPPARGVALLISVLLIVVALLLTAVVYIESGGTVVLLILPLVAPGVILAVWTLLAGRNDRP
jgi:hypothetical protein